MATRKTDDHRYNLEEATIAIPLLRRMGNRARKPRAGARAGPTLVEAHDVIIDLNLNYGGGRDAAHARVEALVEDILRDKGAEWSLQTSPLDMAKNRLSQQYLFGSFEARFIEELVRRDRVPARSNGSRAIHRIWPDFDVKALTYRSICTVKADAAQQSFSTTGEGIVWAVMDSGIDALHAHFETHANLDLHDVSPLAHTDLTGSQEPNAALVDRFGHGTHVAGIIAGMIGEGGTVETMSRVRDEMSEVTWAVQSVPRISGMAPRCKLVSMKVLDDKGQGKASSVIAALEVVQELNSHGRHIKIHGVNLSVGYTFEPEWFACGQSPLCVEVNRLAKSGVVVVTAAGNTGYGTAQSAFKGAVPAGIGLTINDPGNAELAITVGSTHRDMPHVYGVSYFSSKGPTGDGRAKPDLVAPGEKIVSCHSSWRFDKPAADGGKPREPELHGSLQALVTRWQPADAAAPPVTASALESAPLAAPTPYEPQQPPPAAPPKGRYREDSGTSMAAPHVSGVIAAFLSVRREFIGQPEKVKEVFVGSAIDLRRDAYFQASGLVDLMRAIQSV